MTRVELFDKYNNKQKRADKAAAAAHLGYKTSTNKDTKREFKSNYLKWTSVSQVIGNFLLDANLIESDE